MRQHNLPTEITIGPIRYAVKVVASIEDDPTPEITYSNPATDNTSDVVLATVQKLTAGMIDTDKCEISIYQEANHQRKVLILMHEVIHGVLSNAGLDDHDERLVESLACGLTDVLRRNPELVQAIMEMHAALPDRWDVRGTWWDVLKSPNGAVGDDLLMNTTRR